MVGVLISMKMRVLRHSFKGLTGFYLVFGALFGLAVAAAFLVYLAVQPAGITVGADVAAAVFAVWTLGWLFGPILTGGGDETLHPENFALLPVRPTTLAFGLLGASLAGVAPIVSALVFAGLVLVAIPAGVVTVVVAVLAAVLQLALAVLASKVVIAGIGALLGSRRGKDLAVLLASLAGLAYFPASLAIQHLGPLVTGASSPVLTGVLRGLPTGWGSAAVVGAAAGDLLPAVGWLAALAVLDGLLLVAWSRLLARRLTTTAATAGPRKAKAVATAGRRSRRALLPDSPLGAVIGKELVMWRRDAQRRTLMLSAIAIGVILPVVWSMQGIGTGGMAFGAIWVVVFASIQVGNLYGLDGTAVWQTVLTPGAARVDVRGRQWAWALVVAPAVVAMVAILPAVTGSAGSYPWLLGIIPAIFGAGAGTVVLASVRAPYPMPTTRNRNPFASGGRPSAANLLAILVIMLLLFATAIPPLVLLVVGQIAALPVLTWLAVPLGVAIGVGAAFWFGRMAHRRLETGGPEVLAAVRAPV